MRFHNNCCTLAIVTNDKIADIPKLCFLVSQVDKEDNTRSVTMGRHQPSYTFNFDYGDLTISRLFLGKGIQALICNTGIRMISLEYDHEEHGLVGPSCDVVLPKTFQEIGAGPGVKWHVVTYRGRRDADHASMEK